MRSVNLAVLGGPGAKDLAAQIGKKGSETDVTQYNVKKGEDSLTLFVPAKYPDKVQGVVYALAASDHVLMVVDALDRSLGEQVVAADLAGARSGFLLLRNFIQPEQVQPLLKGTALEDYALLDTEDPNVLRERFLDLEPATHPGETKVDIDQHFNVKGVGTVVLGVVARGEVKRHQELVAHPTRLKCQVRSIQVHDTDVEGAPTGSRVGLALKNIENDLLDRGMVLAPEGTVRVVAKGESLELVVRVPPFYKAGLKDGQVVHVAIGMQFVPARLGIEGGALAAGKEGPVRVAVDNPVVVDKGDAVLLCSLDNPTLRVAGGARVA